MSPRVADPARCHEGVPSLHEQPDENGSLGGQHRALHGRQSPSEAGGHGDGGGGVTAAALPSPHPTGEGHQHIEHSISCNIEVDVCI